MLGESGDDGDGMEGGSKGGRMGMGKGKGR